MADYLSDVETWLHRVRDQYGAQPIPPTPTTPMPAERPVLEHRPSGYDDAVAQLERLARNHGEVFSAPKNLALGDQGGGVDAGRAAVRKSMAELQSIVGAVRALPPRLRPMALPVVADLVDTVYRQVGGDVERARRNAGKILRPIAKTTRRAAKRAVRTTSGRVRRRRRARRRAAYRGDMPAGARQALEFAHAMDPAAYAMGGFGAGAIDCSGMVSATVNVALGRDPFESRMSTTTEREWLAARGARPGLGGPNDLSIGFYDYGGGPNGHTALTIAGVNVESNGSDGVVVGGAVGAGHSMFAERMHIPAELLRGRRGDSAVA